MLTPLPSLFTRSILCTGYALTLMVVGPVGRDGDARMAPEHECDRCGELKTTCETVQIYGGRTYPGVGGGIRPPEYAEMCKDCREAYAQEQAEQARAEQEADW